MKHGAKSNVSSIVAAKPQDDGIEWILPAGRSGGGVRRDPSIVARSAMRFDKTKRSQTLALYLYDGLMKEARLLAGDKVVVGYDKRGYIKLKRVPSGGFMLSPVGTDVSARKSAIGKPATVALRLAFPFTIKARTYAITDVLIDGDTIDLPIELEAN